MNIKSSNDYSLLFDSLNKNNNGNNIFNSINLSDYSGIKSGSYKKLLKEYYKETDKKT